MQLFFDRHLAFDNATFLIEANESNHILRVLRKNKGDIIFVTNGMGDVCKAEISNIISKRCEINILETFSEPPLPYDLHIAIAPTKSADRFEYFLEKSTEIGITEISPIISENSERKRLNNSRCQKIIQSAMKQSQRCHLPKLNELRDFKTFINSNFDGYNTCIAHCEDDQKRLFQSERRKHDKILILIGPEGDFSPEEIKLALSQGFKAVSLGDKRLRTETAGIVACAITSYS